MWAMFIWIKSVYFFPLPLIYFILSTHSFVMFWNSFFVRESGNVAYNFFINDWQIMCYFTWRSYLSASCVCVLPSKNAESERPYEYILLVSGKRIISSVFWMSKSYFPLLSYHCSLSVINALIVCNNRTFS